MARRRDYFAARREALGFTQESLAHQLGVELSTVGRWERGTLMPQPWRRPDLAGVLRVSLQELDGLLTPPQPSTGGVLATRREVMVDAAVLTGGLVAGHVVGTCGQEPVPDIGDEPPDSRITMASAAARVAEVHRVYQAARYGDVARRLPSVTVLVERLVGDGSGPGCREALGLRCSVAVVAAKLATKAGDADSAWAAAEQARVAAESAEDLGCHSTAVYQRACALLCAGRSGDAEQMAVGAADDLGGNDPESMTWRGALSLLGALIAARRHDAVETEKRLDHADDLARRLGADANIGWSAFGPTNVLIHRVSAAVARDDPRAALAVAERLDVTAFPAGLKGRQAQLHLDSAWAHAQLREDPQAVIHLLDTERVAPELVLANPHARALIQDLLARERRRVVPGLRGLAVRAGVAA